MRKTFVGALIVAGAACVVLAPGSQAQANQPSRQSMEKCVGRVLATMARAKAPEVQVGSAVTTQCDSPLRATLAEAIKKGEAGGCTVDACLDLARTRASAEAIAAYRQMTSR
ncbi:MAG: hypothetical protein ACJ8CS_16750 [Microvirga sp.]|jgi:hypothetical protein